MMGASANGVCSGTRSVHASHLSLRLFISFRAYRLVAGIFTAQARQWQGGRDRNLPVARKIISRLFIDVNSSSSSVRAALLLVALNIYRAPLFTLTACGRMVW